MHIQWIEGACRCGQSNGRKAILQSHERCGWQAADSACQLPNWWTLQACSAFKEELKSVSLPYFGGLICTGKARKARRVLEEEVECLFQNIFGSVFFQTYSLGATINFRKIKHHNEMSTKLLALEIYTVSCACERRWIKPPSWWASWLEHHTHCNRLCHGWLDCRAEEGGVSISKIRVVASTTVVGGNLNI